MPTQRRRIHNYLFLLFFAHACTAPVPAPCTCAAPPDAAERVEFADSANPDADVLAAELEVSAGADADAVATSKDASEIDTYDGILCSTNGACKAASPQTPWCNPVNHHCVQCLFDGSCKSGQRCDENKQCVDIQCNPGDQICDGTNLNICNDDGKSYTPKSCPNNMPLCVAGVCQKCIAKTLYCGKQYATDESANQVMQCADDGLTAKIIQKCPADQFCVDQKCVVCQAGLKKCDFDKAMICAMNGLSWQVQSDCGADNFSCQGGICIDPCDPDTASNSFDPCEFWAVDLHNSEAADVSGQTAQNQPISVALAVRGEKPAKVVITAGTGQISKFIAEFDAVTLIKLPDPTWKDPSSGLPLKPLNQQGTSINNNAYHIKADHPITATQFNPADDGGNFPGEATQLIDVSSIGYDYLLIGREQTLANAHSFFTVVAASHGHTAAEKAKAKTHVTVVSSAPTSAGIGINAMKAGDTQEFDLAYGQVLHVETSANGADLTGTSIQADRPVAVFSGSQAAFAPNTDHCVAGVCEFQGWACASNADCPTTCCPNHLEEQMPQVTGWGTYVAAKFQPRGKEKVSWRILALVNGTVVTTSPPQTDKAIELNAGKWLEFESAADFVIQANDKHPIEVAQFMHGSSAPEPENDVCTADFAGQKVCAWFWVTKQQPLSCNKNTDCPNIPQGGDAITGAPSFVILTPTHRYLDAARFYVPTKFAVNYINIIIPLPAFIKLDGVFVPASAFTPVAAGWAVARLPVAAGAHALEAKVLFGLIVYGWSDNVSYSYAAPAAHFW